MKVLYLYDGKMNGHGLDLVTEYQLKALSRHGWQVDLVSRGRVELPGVDCRKVVFNPAKLISFLSSKTYYAANRRWLARVARGMLRRKKYDVVVAWQRAALPFFQAAHEMGIPCVLSSAASTAFRDRRKTSWLEWTEDEVAEEYRLASLVLAPSSRTRDLYLAQGLPDSKVRSIERGFDPAHFYPAPVKPDPFRVLYCGRVCDRKGARQLLDAWNKANLPDSELWYAGAIDGSLQAWVNECRRPDIKFLGFRADVGDLMRQCTVHALLSSKESMGKSFIEAAACGLVNLATKEVGFPVIDGVNGLVVDRDNTAEVADALKRLHYSKELCQTLGSTAREEVHATYTWDAFMDRFSTAVEDAAASST